MPSDAHGRPFQDRRVRGYAKPRHSFHRMFGRGEQGTRLQKQLPAPGTQGNPWAGLDSGRARGSGRPGGDGRRQTISPLRRQKDSDAPNVKH